MKRFRIGGVDHQEAESVPGMAHALLLLSHGVGGGGGGGEDRHHASSSVRVFECKTCNRQFPSFQALGGHRASHKKPKLARDGRGQGGDLKPRVHECSVCGLEFAVGQALGGHMRRHRTEAAAAAHGRKGEERRSVPWLDLNLLPPSEGDDVGSCRKRVFGFELVDANPVAVDCFQ